MGKSYNRRTRFEHIFIVNIKDLTRLMISITSRTHLNTVSIKYNVTRVSENEMIAAVVLPLTFYEVRDIVYDLESANADLTVANAMV